MNFDRLAAMGFAAALVCLGGCDPRPKPSPPKTQVAFEKGGWASPAAARELTPGIVSVEAWGRRDSMTLVADDGARARAGGGFGVGIRPGRGASGISP